MTVLLLIRHGENDYVKTGKLAGRIPGVQLNPRGQDQARALSDALRGTPIQAVYASPLERALETAQPLAADHQLQIIPEPDLMDTDVGTWQGRSWKVLRLTKAWKIVQNAPSRFRFPAGESFPETQTRVVNVLERIIRKYSQPQALVAVVFHADPIK
ncbi:MAG: histidine phosphatase family protein, partial [Anaerolineales bacterium]|nr:histidine phosphatase family protein [Anaerolineales bacterium]